MVKASAQQRWADDDDDSSVEEIETPNLTSDALPPTITRYNHAKNLKTVITYRLNSSGQTIKSTTDYKIHKYPVKESKMVQVRREWKKFGQAASGEDQSNVTIVSKDDIFMEDPHADIDIEKDQSTKAISGNINAFWAKQQRRQLERKYDVDGKEDEAEGAGEDGWSKVEGDGQEGGGKRYVPPGARGGGAGGRSLAALAASGPSGGGSGKNERDQNTIRVTNIGEDTTDDELQRLFQPFGRISRVYLAKDKETGESRGFAFVSFVHRESAQKAMEKLQGFGFKHFILKLEWAKPSNKDPSKSSNEFRSGYGTALAQDTKQKVSYASNLTK